MTDKKTSIYVVSREYAGIAEAGGVKNVSCSLSEGLVRFGYKVTLFIPLYGCTMLGAVNDFTADTKTFTKVKVDGNVYKIAYAKASLNGVNIVFVIHPLFASKKAVYVYTESEQNENPVHLRGKGHEDSGIINMLFQKAVLYYGVETGKYPDIIHCQDATTAMIPVFAAEDSVCKGKYKNVSFIVTIHNAGPGYHHAFSSMDEAVRFTGLKQHILQKGLCSNRVEPFLLAAGYSLMTTVSPWYADEILRQDNQDTEGLSALFVEHKYSIEGITNGIDFSRYDPSDIKKSLLSVPYNPITGDLNGKYEMRRQFTSFFASNHTNELSQPKNNDNSIAQFGTISDFGNSVIYVYHGRIVQQKGLVVFADTAEILLQKCVWARILIVGQGDSELENRQISLSKKYPGRFLFFRGYERSFTRLCTAISDFLVLPSLFEPCGLEDFIGQIFGTIPVAHATGGLNKIHDGETGFLYHNNNPTEIASLLEKLGNAKRLGNPKILSCIKKGAEAVRTEYSWDSVIKNKYIPLYESLLKKNDRKQKNK